MWHNLFPYMALTLTLPTLIYRINAPLIRTKKCDFHLALVFLFLVLSPASCPVLTQPASRPTLPPLWPPSTLGKRGPCWSYGWGLISSAHLEAGWGLTGVHRGQGLDVLAVTSSVTQTGDRPAAAQCPAQCTISYTVCAPTVLSCSSLICLIASWADAHFSLRNPFTPLIKVKLKFYNCLYCVGDGITAV